MRKIISLAALLSILAGPFAIVTGATSSASAAIGDAEWIKKTALDACKKSGRCQPKPPTAR